MILLDESTTMFYKNGNTFVEIYADGTKIRTTADEENPQPELPESIDLKITDYCDAGCAWCHENSTIHGNSHVDFE
jgi:hypothetical protein